MAKDKAENTMNHANRVMTYYDRSPEEVENHGGIDEVIDAMKARMGRNNTREMLLWEFEHDVASRDIDPVWADWNYPAALRAFRDRHSSGPVPQELYATGQHGRAEGVAEYLTQQGHLVEIQMLPDGERHQGRRYIVIEKITTTLRAVS